MKKYLLSAAALGLVMGSIVPASANVIALNFAGLDGAAEEAPANYYDGGFGSDGSGPGPNYGITFGADTITCAPSPYCNSNNIPGGPGANLLFFLSGSADEMDVAAGFTGGFSFYYSTPYYTGSVTVWSGLDGTGTELADLTLPETPADGAPGCFTTYCPYVPIGVTFSGTAESVEFGGVANYVAFADITLGSGSPAGAPVPEPITLSLFGAGLAGAAVVRRRRKSNKAA